MFPVQDVWGGILGNPPPPCSQFRMYGVGSWVTPTPMFPVQDVWGGILGNPPCSQCRMYGVGSWVKHTIIFQKIQSHLAISPLLMRTSMMSRLTPSDPSDEPTMKWSTHCTHKQKELQTTNGLHVLVLSTSKGFEQQ